MPKYNMTAYVTISLYATIEAENELDAIEKAKHLSLYNDHEEMRPDYEDGNWHTSGELDGEPFGIEISSVDDS